MYQILADGVCHYAQELVKVGCDVRYLNDSYRLNGLKAAAAQQVGPLHAVMLGACHAFQSCSDHHDSALAVLAEQAACGV